MGSESIVVIRTQPERFAARCSAEDWTDLQSSEPSLGIRWSVWLVETLPGTAP